MSNKTLKSGILVANTSPPPGLVIDPSNQEISPGVKFDPRTDLRKGGRESSATVSSFLVLTTYKEFMPINKLYMFP